jgi:hypothetical protein
VLLELGDAFGIFESWLASHDLSQLEDLFFLLLDQNFLLDDLLGLVDEPALEGLNLLFHLVDIRVAALQLTASVGVKWVLELLGQSLNLQLLLDELVLEIMDIVLEVGDLGSLASSLEICYRFPEEFELTH